MQNNTEHINPKDEFSEFVKRKMDDYSVSVDEQCWAEIEQRLRPKHRKIPLGIWLSTASIAAGFALLLILNPFASDSVSNEMTALITEIEKGNIVQNNDIQPESNPELTEEKTEISETKKQLATNRQSPITKETGTIATETEETQATGNIIVEKTTEKTQPEIDEKRKETVKLTTLEEPKEQKENLLPSKKKNDNKWTLALAYGSSSGTSSFEPAIGHDDYGTENVRQLIKAKSDALFMPILSEENFSDVQYLPPMSFGFGLRKNISERWEVMTGINYTYLATSFKNEFPLQDADLQLHYLGIPLNVVLNLFENRQWNIYLSSGGMAEKGIEKYEQNIYQYDRKYTTSKGPSFVDGVQWSANTALGMSYEISRNVGIYCEPRVSYFFKNNQPASLRTKQPFTVSLNIGLQYKLN